MCPCEDSVKVLFILKPKIDFFTHEFCPAAKFNKNIFRR